jgi:hypothetical protein
MVRSRWTSHLQTRLCKQWLGLRFSWIRTGEYTLHNSSYIYVPAEHQLKSFSLAVCMHVNSRTNNISAWQFMWFGSWETVKRFWFPFWPDICNGHLTRRPTCISTFLSNYVPVLHMQSSLIPAVCLYGSCYTFNTCTWYKNKVSL